MLPNAPHKLRYIQTLLSHHIPSGDMAEVLDRTLDLALRQLEKRKFAATENPRPSPRCSKRARHIPAQVKRAVWGRDQGQCTFTSEDGRRCAGRKFLEFDHVDPVARGGRATVDGIRLRCRAHNQYEAERMFGTEFMHHKREQARESAEARTTAEALAQEAARKAAADASARAAAMERAKEQDVVPWLRQLGFRASEAREAAKFCESIPDAPLEERVRVALSFFRPRTVSRGPATNSLGTAA